MIIIRILLSYTCMGDEFGMAFAHLGEIRSIIPSVYVLALTASATKTTFTTVCQRLSIPPTLIGIFPHRENIKYTVRLLPKSLILLPK